MNVATKSRVAEFLNYQEGCIVSRDLIKNPNGGVSMFAFDKNQELSEHTVPFNALVQGLEGEGEILFSGQSHFVHAGEMIILPSGQPHALNIHQRFKMMLTRISCPPITPRYYTKVLNVADFIKYKENAIIDQSVISLPCGRVRIYSYDAGQEKVDTMLLYDALVQVLEGEVNISVQGNLNQLQAGDMILLPAGKSIDIKAVTRFKMMQTVVEPKA